MRSRRLVAHALVVASAAALAAVPAAGRAATPGTAGAGPAAVTVDTSAPGAAAGRELLGLGWNFGPSLAPVARLRPPFVRLDGGLERLPERPGPDALAPLLAKVAEVRRIGAVPQVILSYLPPWLSPPLDPAELDRWEAFASRVTDLLVSADPRPWRFETWNEPDLPTFWPDTPASFLALALRTHRAVAATARRHPSVRIATGGPGSFAPNPQLIPAYVAAVTRSGLPLDFVSWHYYANYPAIGPDGNEGFVPDAVYSLGAHRNPVATPRVYGTQIDMVRAWVAGATAGRSSPPSLVIDEWNFSAGGYDRRHDTNEGAALAAAVLVEMERAGLSAAGFYRAIGSARPGDWGMTFVAPDGTTVRKPVWRVFDEWAGAAGRALPVAGDDRDGGLWARATVAPSRRFVTVVLAAFRASDSSARDVVVRLTGPCHGGGGTRARRLDASSGGRFVPSAVRHTPAGESLHLAAQSVTVLRVAC